MTMNAPNKKTSPSLIIKVLVSKTHQISTPMATGALPPNKCRTTKIPAGLAPGVWRLTGHATSTCTMAIIGAVDVTSALPDTLVTIKAP